MPFVHHILRVSDLRLQAKRKLPRVLFDYVDGGAEDEVTMLSNRAAFDHVKFRPRSGLGAEKSVLTANVLGHKLSLPLLLAPIGYSGLLHPAGEIAAARAASKAGIPYILSTFSGERLESVKANSNGVLWYQLYMVGGRDVASRAIERAKAAGYSALVITIDSAVAGLRERDFRNGMSELLSPHFLPKLPYIGQLLCKPGWLLSYFMNGGMPRLENIEIPGTGALSMEQLCELPSAKSFRWEDLVWIREIWPGPIVIKGVMTIYDAQRAVDEGANAIIVSNHGGRQLDGLPATLQVLPEVVEAVGNRAEVLMDGGIQRGSDVVKALSLGARAVLCGRAYAYGLAAFGECGVNQVIEILSSEVERTLSLLGRNGTAELDSSCITVDRNFATC
jgi:isopentenyl diphosphate isomerase/L-lactate dehydrogenase-like FMN-dependent dehydrogenase